jgi:hypothetical protein
VKCDEDYDLEADYEDEFYDDEDYSMSADQYWWNDSQSIRDDAILIRKIGRDYNHGMDNYSNIKVIKLSNINKVNANNDNQILYDSGAQQSLVPTSFVPRLKNKYKYSKDSPPNVHLFDAGNHPISLAGEGTLEDVNGNAIQDRVFVSNDIDVGGGLLSGPCLRKKGFTVIIPSAESSPDIGIIVHDRDGKVIMVGNQDLIIDTDKIGSYNHQVSPADINNIINSTYSIDAVYGFNSSGISELVQYVQQCLHTTKERQCGWLLTSLISRQHLSKSKDIGGRICVGLKEI